MKKLRLSVVVVVFLLLAARPSNKDFDKLSDASVTLTNPYKMTGRFNVMSKVLSSSGDSLSRTIFIDIK